MTNKQFESFNRIANDMEPLYASFGRNRRIMKEFFDRWYLSTDNDEKSYVDYLGRKMKEYAFITTQLVLEGYRDYLIAAQPYARTAKRKDYRNGYSPAKTKLTVPGFGRLPYLQPQVRKLAKQFTSLLPLKNVPEFLDAYIKEILCMGYSTQQTREIIYQGLKINLAKDTIGARLNQFESEYQNWQTRKLPDKYPYLFADGKIIPICEHGEVHNKMLVLVYGMTRENKYEVLRMSMCESENSEEIYALFRNVRDAGVSTVECMTIDGAGAYETAARTVWIDVRIQRCQFHKLRNIIQNASNKARGKIMMKQASIIIHRRSYNDKTKEKITEWKKKWAEKEPKAVRCFLEDIEKCYVYLDVTKDRVQQKKLRTSNPIERFNRELNKMVERNGYFRSRKRAMLWLYLQIKRTCTQNPALYQFNSTHETNERSQPEPTAIRTNWGFTNDRSPAA